MQYALSSQNAVCYWVCYVKSEKFEKVITQPFPVSRIHKILWANFDNN